MDRGRRLIAVALLLVPTLVSAKPMLPPSDEEAIRSDWVASVEYVGRDTGHKPSYFGGALARYRVVAMHKGTGLEGIIRVLYAFHDNTPCLEEAGWKFREDMMPARGSRFILFLRHDAQSGSYYTYRGVAGRWPLTDENVAKVRRLLAEGAPRR